MTKMNSARLLSLLLALCLLASPALAQDNGSSGSVTVGAQGGSGIDDSSKLQQYEVVPQGVSLFDASFSWKNGAGYFFNFKGANLGLDDQAAGLTFGKANKLNLAIAWDQNPNWMSNTARTPYTEISPGQLVVPEGMRRALQNSYVPWNPTSASNPIGLPPSSNCKPSATVFCTPANPTVDGFYAVEPWVSFSQPIDLRYVRKTGKAELSYTASESLTLSAKYSREARDGNKNTTFYGGPSYEVATPIAFRTHDLRGQADFVKGRVFATASVNLSLFKNEVPFVTIDNPQRFEIANPSNGRVVISDAASFRLWQTPDNEARTFDLTGGVNLGRRHKVTATVSKGNMSMERDLVDLSTNPGLATSATAPNAAFSVAPPYANVNVKYDTFLGTAKLSGDPSTKFGYSVSFRKYSLTDQTGHYEFPSTVRGDVGPSVPSEPLAREHEGFSRQNMKGEVHAQPVPGLRLGVSLGQDKNEYDRREYADIEDRNWTFTGDYTRGKVAAHAGFTTLKRQPGGVNEDAIQPTWEGATQTDIADRHRHILNGLLTVSPTDKVTLSLFGLKQTNEFAESVTGLLDQSVSQYGVDLAFAPRADVTASAGYIHEKYFFDMAAAYIPRGTNPPYLTENFWSNATNDEVDTFRASLTWVLKAEKLDFKGDFDYTRPRNDSQYTFVDGGAGEANGVHPATPVAGFTSTTFSGFPLVKKDFTLIKLQLNYKIDKRVTASVMWWKQKFENADWATQTMLPYMGRVDPGANRWFFLGAQVPSYDANIFRASLSYTF